MGGQTGRRHSGKSRAGQTEQTGPQAAAHWTLAGVWRWGVGVGKLAFFFFESSQRSHLSFHSF